MKIKYFILLLTLGLVLSACGNQSVEETSSDKNEKVESEEVAKKEVKEETTEVTNEEVEAKKEETEEKPVEKKPTIDTSVFEFAKNVEVTDAIDSNQHVTVFVEMSEETQPGMATQHVINQTYDFIQQEDISNAKTVTIAVKQGETKIAQFTVNKDKFTPDDSKPMTEAVINASEIEFMTDEVKQFGQNLGTW